MVPHCRVEQDAELHSARVQQQAYYDFWEVWSIFLWDTLYQIESAMMDMTSWEELQTMSIPIIGEVFLYFLNRGILLLWLQYEQC